MEIGFIGAGRVGTALAVALSRAGYAVVAAADIDTEASRRLAGLVPGCAWRADNQAAADAADLVFVAVPDDRLAQVAGAVAWRAGQSVVHCSGAASLDVLAAAADRGAAVGSFHPLQSFAGLDRSLASIPGTTFAIEAEGPLQEMLAEMTEKLGGRWIELGPGQKTIYHTAAVFAGNYPVALVSLAINLWRKLGFTESEALRALLPLVRGAIENMGEGDPATALTGPVARGDAGTVAAHLEALASAAPELIPAYRQLGLAALRLAIAGGGLNGEKAEELRRLLDKR